MNKLLYPLLIPIFILSSCCINEDQSIKDKLEIKLEVCKNTDSLQVELLNKFTNKYMDLSNKIIYYKKVNPYILFLFKYDGGKTFDKFPISSIKIDPTGSISRNLFNNKNVKIELPNELKYVGSVQFKYYDLNKFDSTDIESDIITDITYLNQFN